MQTLPKRNNKSSTVQLDETYRRTFCSHFDIPKPQVFLYISTAQIPLLQEFSHVTLITLFFFLLCSLP